jgi:catechol 2,3-dioxygenase-like lactoylglutathione lyase family enzyme
VERGFKDVSSEIQICLTQNKCSHRISQKDEATPMLKVSFTTILVNDMEKALTFYEALGFEVIKRDHYPDFVLLQSENFPIALHQVENVSASESRVILGIAVENLSAKIEELSAKGLGFIHDTPQKFFGGHYVGLCDPAGNMLEIIQWNPEVWQKYAAKLSETL